MKCQVGHPMKIATRFRFEADPDQSVFSASDVTIWVCEQCDARVADMKFIPSNDDEDPAE